MISRVESDITHPLCLLFSNFLFTAQAGQAVMFVYVKLLILLFGTIGLLPLLTSCQETTNSGKLLYRLLTGSMLATPEATEDGLVCGVHAVHTSSGDISACSSFKFFNILALIWKASSSVKKLLGSPKYLNTSGAVALEVFLRVFDPPCQGHDVRHSWVIAPHRCCEL